MSVHHPFFAAICWTGKTSTDAYIWAAMINTTDLSIPQFFRGKGVLLTGSTGFLAKAVMEKMLRDLPDIGQIFLLIRHRVKADGSRVEPRERLREEILRNSAFARLREQLGEKFESY